MRTDLGHGPLGSGKNVLTIDIPPEWEATIGAGATGPRLWARTGCRYDIASDRAQCETGGCGGKYDCSAAKLGASVGTTVSEWTFYEHVTNQNLSYFGRLAGHQRGRWRNREHGHPAGGWLASQSIEASWEGTTSNGLQNNIR